MECGSKRGSLNLYFTTSVKHEEAAAGHRWQHGKTFRMSILVPLTNLLHRASDFTMPFPVLSQ
jgi:hypothetical protein